MPKLSAGTLLYRLRAESLEVFLVHPGGPFWKNKDLGSWSIPKGEYDPGEVALEAARREFEEETGSPLPDGQLHSLGEIRQPSGKIVTAWALQADFAADAIKSNSFSMEWPPKSGKIQDFPEVDKAKWFSLPTAQSKIVPGQSGFLNRLANLLHHDVAG